MLASVQTHWLDICEYFTRVQCASSEEEEAALEQELPRVEVHLNVILEALLAEKRALEKEQRAARMHQEDVNRCAGRGPSLSSFTSSMLFNSPTNPNTEMIGGSVTGYGEAGRSPGVGSVTETASTNVPSTPVTARGLGPQDDAPPCLLLTTSFGLPQCYHYLFAPPPPSPPSSPDVTPIGPSPHLSQVPSPEKPHAEDGAETARGVARTNGLDKTNATADLTSVFPDTISSTFLLTLCLYAKHNQPAGSRTVILRFLQRLIQEADLPTMVRHNAHYRQGRRASTTADMSRTEGMGTPRSILQLSLSSSIVPMLDMIRKVGVELDPSHAFGTRGARGGGKRGSSPWKRQRQASESGTLQDRDQAHSDADRTAFVRFLCALAERMEQVPDLANYFITSSSVNGTEDDENDTADHFVLLEILLPYMTHDCTAPGWEQRRDTCRYALSAVLSLSKCPDTWVQDLVAKTTTIADRTLAAACTTLLTLCKIPDNDDSHVQMLYLRDVLRFWSAMCLSAPAVADGLGLPELIESDFAKMALASLFMSPDSRVYSAACVVTSTLLADLNSAAPVVPAAMARALLAGVVDMDTGRRSRHRSSGDYYEVMMRRYRRDATGRGNTTLDAESRMGSFFDYYITSRLTTRPALTEEDLESKAVLNFTITEWTAVEATLTLLASLAENCPGLFAKYAFLADMNDLSSVRLRQANRAAASSPALSAAHSAPTVDVKSLFPARLQAVEEARGEEVCGVTSKQLSEEVFEAMLRIEANAPTDAVYELQRTVMMGDETPEPTSAEEPTKATRSGEVNEWFHPPTAAHAPLTRVLCDLVTHFTALPFRSAILLTQLCVRVCLLPDLRVLYTLLDPKRGPLTEALKRQQHRLEREFEDDDKLAVASAAASAAAAVATAATPATPPTPPSAANGNGRLLTKDLCVSPLAEVMKEEGRRGRSTSAARPLDESTAVAVPPPHFSRIYLYALYLSYWAYLPAHILRSLADERDTRSLEHIASPPNATAAAGPSVVGAPGRVHDDALKALIRHQPFLESCACLGQFRMELDAAVGYMTLSHNLMTLKV